MTIDNSVLFYVLFLHVAQFCLVALLVLISVLFSYLKHLLLLSLVLGAGIKVTNECNSMFGAVVDTGYIADNAAASLNHSVSGQNETGTDRKLSSRSRMSINVCEMCRFEMLLGSVAIKWKQRSAVIFTTVISSDTEKRASVASSGLRYHGCLFLHLAQHISVLCHRMLSAYQSDECH